MSLKTGFIAFPVNNKKNSIGFLQMDVKNSTGLIEVSNGWEKCHVDFSALPNYDHSVPFFRFDFGRRPGREIQVRNILLTGGGF